MPGAEVEDNESEDEGIEDYKLGGYHPVHIGYFLSFSCFLVSFAFVWLFFVLFHLSFLWFLSFFLM